MQHNYSCSPAKFNLVDKILRGAEKDKVLIFAKYVDTQKVLAEKYPYVKIMSYGKHSYGLNLQDYNTIIFFDKTWDYAQREQAERRIYREGQTEDCVYYDLTSNAGLDIMINDNVSKKRNLLDVFKEKSIAELKKEL
jgi:SNF2 family DNA or RNA helicase